MSDAPSPPATSDVAPDVEAEAFGARFETPDDLRGRTARGVLVNSGFQVSFAILGVVQRFAVAAFLSVEQFAIWGLAITTLITLSFLKQIGISDKYIQQDEADQELAFQKAFTLELIYTLGFCVLLTLLIPLYALAYGRSEILLPSLVLVLCMAGSVFQVPVWIFYRRMAFVKQRLLEAINPVLSTIVMVSLAAAGAGYWSLVFGLVAGTYAAGIVAVIACPYPIRLRFDRKAAREYVGFSWPLLVAGGGSLLIVQGTLLVGNYTVGLVGVGVISLASSLLVYTQRVDDLIGRTIYPAICAVKDRRAVLFEAFTKSNRLAVMWGMPFGVAMALFAPDLVHFVIGRRWESAISLMQVMGLVLAFGQIGVSWKLFHQAIGDTRPLAISAAIAVGSFAAITVPLMILFGLTGYMVGLSASLLINLVVRAFFLRRLFSGFDPVRHLMRGVAPSIPAAAAVLGVRLLETGGRSLALALAELALYLAITLAATAYFERSLLRELIGYVRGQRSGAGVLTDQAAGLPA
jgi:O-antigen/teichoic acid export membrane protein